MGSHVNSVLAATAVVKYDLTESLWWKQQMRPRRCVGVALKGSTAAGDTEVEIFSGNRKITNLFNSGTGYPNRDDVVPQNFVLYPGEELHAYVTDAPATNPIFILFLMR